MGTGIQDRYRLSGKSRLGWLGPSLDGMGLAQGITNARLILANQMSALGSVDEHEE